MAGARSGRISTSSLKAKFMNLAQTSQFMVKFQPPADVATMLEGRGLNYRDESGFLELLCNETSLPGSTLATHDKTNDYMGVTEKLAYRRIYDETLDMTFYVDKKYKIIEFFEGWIDWISGVGDNPGGIAAYKNTQVGFRNHFPDSYKTNIHVNKFEKDLLDRQLYHTFVDAFPIAINNIPISYETSDILRFSVSFSYVRYVREYLNINIEPISVDLDRPGDLVKNKKGKGFRAVSGKQIPPGGVGTRYIPDGMTLIEAINQNEIYKDPKGKRKA